MADRDIEQAADHAAAMSGSFPINPQDVWDAVLADDMDDGGPLEQDYYRCATCADTRKIPHPDLPHTRNVDCPDCTRGAT